MTPDEIVAQNVKNRSNPNLWAGGVGGDAWINAYSGPNAAPTNAAELSAAQSQEAARADAGKVTPTRDGSPVGPSTGAAPAGGNYGWPTPNAQPQAPASPSPDQAGDRYRSEHTDIRGNFHPELQGPGSWNMMNQWVPAAAGGFSNQQAGNVSGPNDQQLWHGPQQTLPDGTEVWGTSNANGLGYTPDPSGVSYGPTAPAYDYGRLANPYAAWNGGLPSATTLAVNLPPPANPLASAMAGYKG